VQFGGIAATAVQHCHGRHHAVQSRTGGKNKNGNNQPEVWLREWWPGSQCHATLSWQAGGTAKWMVAIKRKKVTINWRYGSMSDDVAATAVRHCCGRQWAVPSGTGSKKQKKGNNQLEVQAA